MGPSCRLDVQLVRAGSLAAADHANINSTRMDLHTQAARESPQYLAIDKAFSQASFGTTLTLMTLLRLSPVLPFAWANYVFGLSGAPLSLRLRPAWPPVLRALMCMPQELKL